MYHVSRSLVQKILYTNSTKQLNKTIFSGRESETHDTQKLSVSLSPKKIQRYSTVSVQKGLWFNRMRIKENNDVI